MNSGFIFENAATMLALCYSTFAQRGLAYEAKLLRGAEAHSRIAAQATLLMLRGLTVRDVEAATVKRCTEQALAEAAR